MKNYILYCDGGCRGNGKKETLGAWAYVILENNEVIEEFSQVDDNCSTNIRAEMYALSEGLKSIIMRTDIEAIKNINVEVITDSKFICDAFNLNWVDNWLKNNWRKKDKKPVANKDLWELLLVLESMFNHIEYHHCKGHSGIKYNERCDYLLNVEMDKYVK